MKKKTGADKCEGSFRIDLFPHYSGKYFFASYVSFLTIFVIKLC